MSVKKRGRFYHYNFQIFGHRKRGSTKKTGYQEAKTFEDELRKKIREGFEPSSTRTVLTLREAADRFMAFVDASSLKPKSKAYYKNGCRLLENTKLAGVLIPHITADDISLLRFSDGPSNANNALRTLRSMLSKCVAWGMLGKAPKVKLKEEHGREVLLDETAERLILASVNPKTKRKACSKVLARAVILLRETGLRNVSELYSARIEHINWKDRTLFNPHGKSKNARRYIPISERAYNLLIEMCTGKEAGWLFPSNSKCGHITNLSKQFARARKFAGLPDNLVLYCGRHDFATYVVRATGNMGAAMKVLGQSDVRTLMRYNHQEVDQIRDALNSRDKMSQGVSHFGKDAGNIPCNRLI